MLHLASDVKKKDLAVVRKHHCTKALGPCPGNICFYKGSVVLVCRLFVVLVIEKGRFKNGNPDSEEHYSYDPCRYILKRIKLPNQGKWEKSNKKYHHCDAPVNNHRFIFFINYHFFLIRVREIGDSEAIKKVSNKLPCY